MRFMRSDLAEELRTHAMAARAKEDAGEIDGVLYSERTDGDVRISDIRVVNEAGEQKLGKPRGRYLTVSFPTAANLGYADLLRLCDILAAQIREFAGQAESVLICGLGNRRLTADAVGVTAADAVLATHHMKLYEKETFEKSGFFDVAVLTPGVTANTGMEAAALIEGAVRQTGASLVVAVDALAAREASRLARTIQLSDSGIAPGSGIGNRRAALTKETLGVPVLAIGVPTVVDTATLLCDALKESPPSDEVLASLSGLFVSPKEIDIIVRNVGRLIGFALNRAFHGDFPPEELAMMA